MITIRRGRPEDLDGLYRLDLLCFEPPFRFTRSAMRRFSRAPDAVTLVGEDAAGHMLGFLILDFHIMRGQLQAYVVTLDVEPASRRQGLARMLLADAECMARERNASVITLHVSAENKGAIVFYERSDYMRVMFHPDFYEAGRSAWGYAKVLE